ncbi:hypothetical protein EVAR_51179_1 [Eumeta japonica]|uniref:Uncharacterized protein n=1 Tax=Eumeta variegata TaxID=151549 RepID=A0A4C1XFL5_EUMVA|nr:hypothetical protein EVAR_51179_1 [Eumeta japonica]
MENQMTDRRGPSEVGSRHKRGDGKSSLISCRIMIDSLIATDGELFTRSQRRRLMTEDVRAQYSIVGLLHAISTDLRFLYARGYHHNGA